MNWLLKHFEAIMFGLLSLFCVAMAGLVIYSSVQDQRAREACADHCYPYVYALTDTDECLCGNKEDK